jgi:hypothetical protein
MSTADQRERVRALVAMTAPLLPAVPVTKADHLGAVLADAALQAGLRYSTVVRPRVDRILEEYPEASQMSGLLEVLSNVSTSRFLAWTHEEKPRRFDGLVASCEDAGVMDVTGLAEWLEDGSARQCLLRIPGVGPKTVDYLVLLCGRPSIPIDRHFFRFISVAGVRSVSYEVAQELLLDACTHVRVDVSGFERSLWLTLAGDLPIVAAPRPT